MQCRRKTTRYFFFMFTLTGLFFALSYQAYLYADEDIQAKLLSSLDKKPKTSENQEIDTQNLYALLQNIEDSNQEKEQSSIGNEQQKQHRLLQLLVVSYVVYHNYSKFSEQNNLDTGKRSFLKDIFSALSQRLLTCVGGLSIATSEFEKKVLSGDVQGSFPENLQLILFDPHLFQQFFHTMIHASRDPEYYMKDISALSKILYTLTPALLYHVWKYITTSQNKNYYRVSTEVPPRLASGLYCRDTAGFVPKVHADYERFSDQSSWCYPAWLHRLKKTSLEHELNEYEKYFIHNHDGYKSCELSSETSKDLKDSLLYKTAWSMLVQECARTQSGFVYALLERLGAKKACEYISEKSYNVLNIPFILEIVFSAGSLCLLQSASEKYDQKYRNPSSTVSSCIPHFTKRELGMCHTKQAAMVKFDQSYHVEEQLHISKEISYRGFFLKKIFHAIFAQCGSLIASALCHNILDGRSFKSAPRSWPQRIIFSLGELFAKSGLCKNNPCTIMHDRYTHAIRTFFKKHPGLILFFAQNALLEMHRDVEEKRQHCQEVSTTRGREAEKIEEAQKRYDEACASLQEIQGALQDFQNALLRKKRLHKLTEKLLYTRNHPRYRYHKKDLQERMQKTYDLFERHNFFNQMFRSFLTMISSLTMPYIIRKSGDKAGHYGEDVANLITS